VFLSFEVAWRELLADFLMPKRNEMGNAELDVQTSHVERQSRRRRKVKDSQEEDSKERVNQSCSNQITPPGLFESMQMTRKAVASNATEPLA
jgi:hypothetical protein